MLVKTYSRLGAYAGLNPASTSGSFPLDAQCMGEEARERGFDKNTLFLLPFGSDGKETFIKDPFYYKEEFKEGGIHYGSIYHYKLPDFVIGNSDDLLTRQAHKAGLPEDWQISLGSMPARRVPKDVGYFHSFGWSWENLESENPESLLFRTTQYWYTWRNDLWWIAENPRLSVEVRVNEVEFFPNSGRYWLRSLPSYEYIEGPVNRDSVDPEYIRIQGRNHLLEQLENHEIHWSPWSFVDECHLSISANSNELPVITDLFGEAERMHHSCYKRQMDYDYLVQHAYYDACQDIGKMNDNMIANLVEIGEFLLSLLNGKALSKFIGKEVSLLDAPRLVRKHGGSVWLKYRYQGSTTMMDITDYQKWLLKRTDQYFDFLNKHYYQRSYGYASRIVNGTLVECRCQINWRPRSMTGLDAVFKYLHETGLELNPYVLWDMIPFSFIVDWFVPAGDFFSVMSDKDYYTDQYYDFSHCWFSFKYSMNGIDHSVGTRYCRWEMAPPKIEGDVWLNPHEDHPSLRTIIKRVIDSGALIQGLVFERR